MATIDIGSYQGSFIDVGNPDAQFVYWDVGNTASDYCIIGNNVNAQTTTYSQSGSECISLYSFLINIPSSAIIESAKVYINGFYGNSTTTGAYPTGITVLATDGWSPDGLSWNNQPAIYDVLGENYSIYGDGVFDFTLSTITPAVPYRPSGIYSLDLCFVSNRDIIDGMVDLSNPSGWGGFFYNSATLSISYTLSESRRRIISW